MAAPGAELPAGAAAKVSEPASAGSVWHRCKQGLKAAYILGASVLSIWVVSFTPAEGPPIWRYVPADGSVVLQVRSGADVWRTLSDNRALLEALDDPDINTLFGPLARRDQALERLRQAPPLVRSLVTATPEALFPVVGRECAVASLAPLPAQDADSPDAGGGSKHPRTVTPVLVFTRVSGSLGQLVRMAAPLARLPRHVRFYDLGGDLVAVGINGAQPAAPPLSFSASSSGGPAVPTQTARLIARVVIAPASLRGQRVESRLPPAQYEQLRQGGVPESVLHALQQPPAVTEMLNMTPAPARICLDLCPTAEGGFTASGRMVGRIAAPPAAGATIAGKMPQSRTSVFAEALLPLDVRACFLRYLVSQMAPGKDPAMLARGQRRWSHRFSELEGRDVDLDRDLWPAFGHALHFSLEEDKLDPAGYALLSGSVPLAGDVQAAREAAEELIRERWSGDVFDGAIPSHVKPPYVKLVKEPAFDHYLLNTGQLGVPSWVIAPHVFAFTSNVGPYALRDPSSLPRPSAAPAAPPATSYFLWADGPRLAPTVERLATAYYDSLEEDFGNPKEFLAHYPDVPLYVRLWRKLTGLLGRFRLEIRPEAGGEAAMIHIAWTPGTTAVPAPEQTDAAPPPPPAGE